MLFLMELQMELSEVDAVGMNLTRNLGNSF